jgi:SAM-dependent methyltransferase
VSAGRDGGPVDVEGVERARAEGVHYLVVPRDGADRLPAGFEDAVRAAHRVVLDDDVCAIFALQPAPAPAAPARDGLPFPPPEFVGLTMGVFDVPGLFEGFFETGALDAQSIRDVLRPNRIGVRRLDAMLDFGCGCGRVLRHWSHLPATRVHGSDFNPYMIEWCRTELPFAGFSLNGVAPPLDLDDASFDLVYAISVFTHLLEPLQVPWLRELARVVRPGGHVLVSLNGARQADALLDAVQRELFAGGRLAQIWPDRAGSNACTVFHPARYRRADFAIPAGLEVVDERADAVCNAGQDLLLLRRP